jgi:thiamine kinase-like enzyme
MYLETLHHVLNKMFGVNVHRAEYKETELQGGTLGDVRLIEGTFETESGEKLPYKVVLKIQGKWERPGDPDSWRREYDLYLSDLGEVFRPKCYHAEMSGDKFQIWLEYVEGVSGNALTTEMLEQATYEIGRFQGEIFSRPELAKDLFNFSDTGYLKRDYEQWHRLEYSFEQFIAEGDHLPDNIKQALKDGEIQLIPGKSFEYSYLRSAYCALPQHLKQMIFDIDDNMDTLFGEISKLPVVLCHRDFWLENIIFSDGKICLIDWDTSDWGYLGEDLASLIADDYDFNNFEEYCQRLIPAYYRGISEYMDISGIKDRFIREMILIKFGYRMVQAFMFAENASESEEAVQALQKVFSFLSKISN